jgi:prepilin-type N-terminal cleavage/methylation domain-containing protein
MNLQPQRPGFRNFGAHSAKERSGVATSPSPVAAQAGSDAEINAANPRGSHSSRTLNRAFTLLEVLVALTIFSLVLSLLYGSWRILIQSNAAGLRIAANAHRTRMTIQTIEEALNSAVFFNANARHYAFIAEGDSTYSALSFVSHLAPSFPGSGRFDGEKVRRVSFTVEPDENGSNALMLYQNSLLDQVGETAEAYPILLARDVSLFEVMFLDTRRGEFMAEWRQTNSLPPLVRVTVGFGQKSRFSKEPNDVVTRIIRIPSAGVAGEAQSGLPVGGANIPQ